MLKEEELNNPESTLAKAAMNEPLFILRGQDALAAKTIRDWACRLLDLSNVTRKSGNYDLANRQRDKAARAFDDAGKIEAWQAIHYKKTPD
jgi:hypothetical protein